VGGDRQDNFDIYVKDIASGRMNRLTDDPDPEISPVWSPDGRWIAYVRMLSGTQAQLLVTPAQGIAAAARCVASFPAPSTYYERFKFLAWSPDSENLVYSVPERTGDLQGLFLLNVVSGAHTRLTSPPPNYDDLSPSFSNDGAHLAFVRYCGRTSGDLFIMPLPGAKQRTGSPERATFYDRLVSTPAWLADSRNLVFARYEMPGVPSIWRMSWPAKGGPEALPISADSTFSLDLSRDGKRFVYSRESFNTNIWAIQVEKAGTAQSAHQWARTSSVDYNPQFSPDGKRVAFSSLRSGHSEIWIADSDGSHPHQMTHTNATVSGFPRWAPDGRTVVFHSRTKSFAALYLLTIEGGTVDAIPMASQNDYNPSFSQDGKWVYFSSRRAGTPEVWKIRARGGFAVQITRGGGLVPLESPDGRFLYYIKFGSFDLWRQPCAGGPESLVFPGAIAAKGTAYAVTAGGVYLIRSAVERGELQLGFFDLKNSNFRAIAPIPKPLELGLGVSPDQRTILFSQQDHLESDLMLVENFH
jgi:Tol biopolymer transport system component